MTGAEVNGYVRNKHVEIVTEGGIGRLTFSRPEKRNAITAEMWDAIAAGVDTLRCDSDLRALLAHGSGGSFCAGSDLGSVKTPDGLESQEFRALALRGIAAIRNVALPTAAYIDGPCIGAGCSIALACDIRFATPASAFAIPAVKYGLAYDDGGIRRLVELVGSGQASHLLRAGRVIHGREAAALGLIGYCGEDAQAACGDYLARLAQADPAVVAATRRSIRRFAGSTWTPAPSTTAVVRDH